MPSRLRAVKGNFDSTLDDDHNLDIPSTVDDFLAARDHNAITRDIARNMDVALTSMSKAQVQTLLNNILDVIRDEVLRGRFLKVLGVYSKENPWKCAFFVLGIALMLNPLSLMGFGALGPIAGSMAAAWQASIGSVAVESLFSVLQAAGMTGAIAIPLAGVGITTLAAVAHLRGAVGPQRWLSGADGSPVTEWAQGQYGRPVEEWWKGKYGTPVAKWWNGDYGNPVRSWWGGSRQ
ncbi:hypothetical protein FPV67DRAFT_1167946 [Lyophyllum atratum]|nr:hypothetical protein FPV67DRAFT_1167946 [Lyophyllum atratum]